MSFHVPNKYRVRKGMLGTDDSAGQKGLFFIPLQRGVPLRVIAHDGVEDVASGDEAGGWEHVSVSLPNRCPTWIEMDHVKRLFWEDEDAVMQLHPPRSQWVNLHPFCLHLWRPVSDPIPLPPAQLVGPVTG